MTNSTNRRRRDERRRRADEVLADYVSGPAAATEATIRAMARLDEASAVLIVEGISDQIAVEAVAKRYERDLLAEGIAVVPIGGAQAIRRVLASIRHDVHIGGLCDAGEESVYCAALTESGYGPCETRIDLERLDFFVCEADLEDELIRAVGPSRVEEVFDREGDLGSFRTMQQQPPWRHRPIEQQMRRFLGAGARRKSRYARLLVEAVGTDHIPHPLAAALHRTRDTP